MNRFVVSILFLIATPHLLGWGPPGGRAWLLAQVGLNESYRVRHLATFFNRVFLSIETKSHNFPTFIESEWPDSFIPVWASIFPQATAHAQSAVKARAETGPNGKTEGCHLIYQAYWSEADQLGRLWLLDIGLEAGIGATNVNGKPCPPKLLAFDLLRKNAVVSLVDCGLYLQPGDKRMLHIALSPQRPPTTATASYLNNDIEPHANYVGFKEMRKFVFFIRSEDPHLYGYNLVEHKWLKCELFSRKYAQIPEVWPVMPLDFTFSVEGVLLLSDNDGFLYTATTDMIDSRNNSNGNNRDFLPPESGALPPSSLNLTRLGTLLGASHSMRIHPQDASLLYYAVPKFGAIVRCDYRRRNLSTSHNEIVYITAKNVQQIFFSSDNSIWLLTERMLEPGDHCFMPNIWGA